jgi:hypothetical protein
MRFIVRITIGSLLLYVSFGLAGILWPGLRNSALAETIIAGTSNDARVEANDTELTELLTDFRDKFGLTYNSLLPLNNKRISGTFTGPLISILAGLLKDYDHALKVVDGHVFLVLTNQQKSTATAPASLTTAGASTAPSVATGSPVRADTGTSGNSDIGRRVASTEGTAPAPLTSPQQPSSRAPYPFAVTNFLQTQATQFVSRDSAAASAISAPGVSVPSAAAMEQTLQHANQTLQSLAGSLTRLPK